MPTSLVPDKAAVQQSDWSVWWNPLPGNGQQLRTRVLAFDLALFCCVPVYVIVFLALGAPISAGIVGACGAVLIFNAVLLSMGCSPTLCGHILTGSAWCTYTGLACLTGGHNAPSMMWHTTIPVFAIVLTNIRSGALWSAASLGATTVLYTLNAQGIELPNEVASSGLRFLEYSGLVGLMCFIFSLMFFFTRIESIVERRTNEAMQRAEMANQAKSEFLANMSHEIRTPMTAIMGFADLLSDDGNVHIAAEHRAETVNTIKRASTHLMTIINDILDLSKIEAGKMTVESIDTSLIRVLHEVTSLMRPRAIGKGLTLETKLQSPVPEKVIGDPTRLRQVLLNLVGNAIKFTDTGRVSIAARVAYEQDRALILFEVEVTGPGMSPEQAEGLFTPFSQADTTVTRKYGGTGLGLTICHRLADIMGGNVAIVRTAPGMGACFRLTLPLQPVAGAAMVNGLEVVQASSSTELKPSSVKLNGKILLAEDGIDNQRLIAFHLRKAGAVVDIADNGLIALKMIDQAISDQSPYQLLLTDMQMPEMDGYVLAQTLRSRHSDLPVVALTAHAMAEDRDKCLKAGCNDYTSKPIEKATLLQVCQRWMA